MRSFGAFSTIALLLASMVFMSGSLLADHHSKPKLKCGTLNGEIVCADRESDAAKKIHGDLMRTLGGKDCIAFALGADLKAYCAAGIRHCQTDSGGNGVCCCKSK